LDALESVASLEPVCIDYKLCKLRTWFQALNSKAEILYNGLYVWWVCCYL